jgi:hypothetical protein
LPITGEVFSLLLTATKAQQEAIKSNKTVNIHKPALMFPKTKLDVSQNQT